MIVVVTGLLRSGTTCMMRMLEAGGLSLFYDKSKPLEFSENKTDFINYNVILRETDKINDLKRGDSSWLDECEGKAIKILNPAIFGELPRKHYYFIWMDRKFKHMEKSARKYFTKSGKTNLLPRDEAIASLRDFRLKGLSMLKNIALSKLLIVKFDVMLEKPKATAIRVASFLNLDLNVSAMAAVVIKRPAHCLNIMMEEEIYKN